MRDSKEISESYFNKNIFENAIEAYIFFYDESFCDFNVAIGISFQNNNPELNVVTIKKRTPLDSDTKMKICFRYTQILTQKEWEQFQIKILKSDFWFLEYRNPETCFDGDNLDVLGYSPVQVVSHNTRWRTTSEDTAGDDQNTNETTFENYLSYVAQRI